MTLGDAMPAASAWTALARSSTRRAASAAERPGRSAWSERPLPSDPGLASSGSAPTALSTQNGPPSMRPGANTRAQWGVGMRRRRAAARAGVVNAVLRALAPQARERVQALPDGTASQAALAHSVPDWIAERLFAALGPDDARATLRAVHH